MPRHIKSMRSSHKQASARQFREITMMKKILLATALALAPTAVMAADLPMKAAPIPAPIYDWTGFYIGVSGGGSLGSSDHIDRATGLSDVNGYNIKGGLVGGTIGYNWQVSSFVVGFEGDWSWANEYGSNTDLGPNGLAVAAANGLANPAFLSFTKETWVATARGRLGYAVNNLLFYGTGGFAAAGAQAGIKDSSTLAVLATQTSTHSGWVAGGGIEWGFAPNWSAKFELLDMELNRTTFVTAQGEGPRIIPLSDIIFRAGINFRFGGPAGVVAKY
jgi:outer membrane immunogenic protein